METKLIEIVQKDGLNTVSARELHEKLNVKTRYNDWVSFIIGYGFEENKDFILVTEKRVTNNPKNPTTNYTNHYISIDMAKEICMIQRNEIGKKFRRYFIECEKKLKEISTPKLSFEEMTLKVIDECHKRISDMSKIIEEQKPKVEFADKVSQSKDCIDIGEFAKLLNDENISIGRNRLFNLLRKNKILMNNNLPYQEYINSNYFDVIETTKDTITGVKVFQKTLVTGAGQIWLLAKIKKYLGGQQ